MSLRCKNISIARRLGATMVLLATSAVVRGFVARTRTSRGVSLFASSTTVSAANPLLQQENLPKFTSIQPSDLTPAVETLLEKLEKDFSHLEEKLQDDCPVYDAVLPEIERMQFPVGFVWGVAGHLNGVLNSDDLREAYESNQGAIVKAMSQFSQSRPVYNALQELLKEPTPEKESFEDQQKKRALELSLRSMQLGGVGLEGEQKERFNAIKMRLATLGTSFGNNILDETKAFSKTITDATSMKGVPVSARALWAAAYQQATKAESADPDNGPWRITLDMPSYIAVLSHMRDRKIREEVYLANIRRASESSPQGKNNVPLIYEILKLKAEMANMLGFDNYAEMSLVSKMAPSIESVRELSDLILEKALPAAKQELAEITQLAKENGFPANETLQPWDTTFWSERLKETKFDLTEEQTRPYFALPAVLDGMFSLVERIFQVSVKAADGEAEVWHPDVKFFKVFDCESNEHIASFFLDPYSRPENKRGGAWMDVCIGKSSAVQRKVPVAYLTCNGSPPVGETPSLMTFRESVLPFRSLSPYTFSQAKLRLFFMSLDTVFNTCSRKRPSAMLLVSMESSGMLCKPFFIVKCNSDINVFYITENCPHNSWKTGAMTNLLFMGSRSTGKQGKPCLWRCSKNSRSKKHSMQGSCLAASCCLVNWIWSCILGSIPPMARITPKLFSRYTVGWRRNIHLTVCLSSRIVFSAHSAIYLLGGTLQVIIRISGLRS